MILIISPFKDPFSTQQYLLSLHICCRQVSRYFRKFSKYFCQNQTSCRFSILQVIELWLKCGNHTRKHSTMNTCRAIVVHQIISKFDFDFTKSRGTCYNGPIQELSRNYYPKGCLKITRRMLQGGSGRLWTHSRALQNIYMFQKCIRFKMYMFHILFFEVAVKT